MGHLLISKIHNFYLIVCIVDNVKHVQNKRNRIHSSISEFEVPAAAIGTPRVFLNLFRWSRSTLLHLRQYHGMAVEVTYHFSYYSCWHDKILWISRFSLLIVARH